MSAEMQFLVLMGASCNRSSLVSLPATEHDSQTSQPNSTTDVTTTGLSDANAALDPLSLSASKNRLRRLNSEYARQMSVLSGDEQGLDDVTEVSLVRSSL